MTRFAAFVFSCTLILTVPACGSGGGVGNDGGMDGGLDGGVDAGVDGGIDAGLPPVTSMEPELLTGSFFRGVWGTSDQDLFAVGGDGLIAHYDGVTWTPFEVPEEAVGQDFQDVFGFASDNVYAVAERGVIVHFDGAAWTLQEIEGDPGRTLYGVWGSAPDDIYASGDGVVVHYDGTSWSTVSDPVISGIEWRGIGGSGPNEVLLAGEGGFFNTAHFLHFDGANWNDIAVPPMGGNTYLTDVWSVGPNAAFAVGVPGRILAWNGSTLSDQDSGTTEALNGVWAASQNDVFAVGVRNTVVRYNGSQWNAVDFDFGTDNVRAVFGFAGNDVIGGGRGAYRFNGAIWEVVLPSAEPRNVWASGQDNALILGANTLRYDGETARDEDFGGLTVPPLVAGWGPADNIVLVGADGSAFLYDGESWGAMTTNNTNSLTDVWGSDVDNVFAVGSDGTILNFNGAGWGAMASGTSAFLAGVSGTGPDNVYAVGDQGTILRYNGVTWSPMESGVDDFLRDVLAIDESTIYVPFDGGLLVGDGVSWVPQSVDINGMDVAVFELDGTAPDNLFISGTGFFGHYDGTTTTPLPALPSASFVTAPGPRTVFAGSFGSFDERVIVYSVP